MIALSAGKLKMFSPESEIFLWIKPKKNKKHFFVESLDQCRSLEVREKARNVFCDEPTSVSNQLSYEVTDVGSWSFVSSNEPVKNGCEVIYEMFDILNCEFEIKWAMIIAVMSAT